MQMQLLPGSFHWVVKVVHLLVGMAAMGMARRPAVRLGGTGRAPSLREVRA